MSALKFAINSHLRVLALAEVVHRYGAIVTGLSAAIAEVVDDVEPEVAARLGAAVRDAEAQLAATRSALDRALKDLPEGSE